MTETIYKAELQSNEVEFTIVDNNLPYGHPNHRRVFRLDGNNWFISTGETTPPEPPYTTLRSIAPDLVPKKVRDLVKSSKK